MTNQWVTPTSDVSFGHILKKVFESDINIKKLEDAIQNRMYLGFLFFLKILGHGLGLWSIKGNSWLGVTVAAPSNGGTRTFSVHSLLFPPDAFCLIYQFGPTWRFGVCDPTATVSGGIYAQGIDCPSALVAPVLA